MFDLFVAALLVALATPAPSPSPPPAAPAVVHTKDFAYAPPVLTVAAGTTVTFVNDEEPAHTVTAVDKSFDSGNMDEGASWSYTFKKPGTYEYICTYHPFMKGKIVVTGSP